ncbi:hypothetical protein [Longimicrobium sp.]|jgi:hypothetical protein|uniref:hypothetical protein n=1 Tax=Longimicrobium sp. TaxID=2029185 RepID=UPI002ED77B84
MTNGQAMRSGRIKGWVAALVLLVVACWASPAAAVSVSPIALYLDQTTRTGTLTLYNSGTLPEEVEIGFAFGYPVSDSAGNVSVPLFDTAAAGEPSAVEWMRAFPRRLRLEAGQRQVVRVMAQPPAGLANGEYWARVLVRSRGGQPPIEQTQGAVTLQLNVETVVVAAAVYRNGPVTTAVGVQAPVAVRTPEGVRLQLDLARQGSAAYLGRIRAELLAPGGDVVAEASDEIAIYHQMRRRLVIPFTGTLGAGYRVRYTVETERPDLPPGGVLKAPNVSATIPVS